MVFNSTFYEDGDTITQSIEKLRSGSLLEDERYTAVELPNSEESNHSPVFRNKLTEDGLIHSIHPDLDSLPAIFNHHAAAYPNKPALSYLSSPTAKFTPISFRQLKDLALKVGSGIVSIFDKNFKEIDVNDEDFVLAIYSPNRYEWVLTDIAAQYYSITSTALYDTLGPNSTKFILGRTKSPIVFLTRPKIESLLTLINDNPNELSTIKVLISFDKLHLHSEDSHLLNLAKSVGVQLYDFEELIRIGSLDLQLPQKRPTLSTRLCISFTSGTSGTPKGVILTQQNALGSTIQCSSTIIKSKSKAVKPTDDGSTVVLYPLAHVMERAAVYIGLTLGSNLHFPYSDDIKTNIASLASVRPHSMSGVPRIYNRLTIGLKSKLDPVKNPSLKVKLINKAIAYKLKEYKRLGKTHEAKHLFYDFLLSKLAKAIGFDEIICLYSGSAPMQPEDILYLKAVLNIWNFVNGYGLTESFGGVLVSLADELVVDNLGPPGITVEVRLLDIPEMGYEWSKNRSGELLLRGPAISPGYLELEQTLESYDSKGWFKTGDIVSIDKQGKIRVIDRRKNFFKLSQGEYITPEKIENTYLSGNPGLINQIWCYGDSFKHYLIGFVGVDYSLFKLYLADDPSRLPSSFKLDELDFDNYGQIRSLFDDLEFKKGVLKYLNGNVDGKLQGFEKLKNIYIDFEPLKQENDTITQTLKVKRHIAKKVFAKEIEKIYEEGELIKRERL